MSVVIISTLAEAKTLIAFARASRPTLSFLVKKPGAPTLQNKILQAVGVKAQQQLDQVDLVGLIPKLSVPASTDHWVLAYRAYTYVPSSGVRRSD